MTKVTPIALTLYGTEGCHLCEQATEQLKLLVHSMPIVWEACDIALDGALMSQFGDAIPVLQFPDNTVLRWPYTISCVQRRLYGFLAREKA